MPFQKIPYDDPRFSYPQFWSERKYENISEQIALSHFFKKIYKKNLLVDIGGGYGRNTKFFSKFFKKCILVDPSDKQLQMALKKVSDKNVDIIKSSSQNLPFPNNTFDVAVLIRVIHHLEHPEEILKEISRVLRKNGFLILEFANKTHFRAIIKNFLTLNFSYLKNIKPIKISQTIPISEETVIYLNFHPKYIEKILKNSGFKIIMCLSVSNLRSHALKKIFPINLLLWIETFLQKSLAKYYFGPSIFVLAQKREALS